MFKLKHPIKPLHLNQKFGGNKATYAQFGLAGHNGLDMRAYNGQPIYASHDGIANYEVDNSQGHGIDIVGTKIEEISGVRGYLNTRYWHLVDPVKQPQFLSPIYGKKNVRVKAGDLIGYANSTGFSTGTHLHFGLKLKDRKGNTLSYGNGYKGALDPYPFLEETEKPKDLKLALGEKGLHVTRFQNVLKKTGYFPQNQELTDYYGPITEKAYTEFKESTHLLITVDNPPIGNETGVDLEGMLKLNLGDWFRGIFVALLTGMWIAIAGLFVSGFDVFSADWGAIGRLAVNGGFFALAGYINKNLFTASNGKIFGVI